MVLATAAKGATGLITGLGAVATYRYRTVIQRENELPKHILSVFNDKEKGEATTTNSQTSSSWWWPLKRKQAREQDSKKNNKQQQRVIVIGAGVVGVSTAYKLALQGHEVVVLEPAPKPGEECSHCAAGGMQRQNVVVNRDTWISVLKCIIPTPISRLIFGGPIEPFQFFQIAWLPSLSDPFFLRWVLTFTKTSLIDSDPHRHEKQQHMLNFTKFAVSDMISLFEQTTNGMAKAAGYNTRGSLGISYDPNQPPGKANPMNLEPFQMISAEQALKEEPSLKFQEKQLTSAKQELESKSAHSGRFSKELATWCETDPKLDVTFHYETKVQGISVVHDDKNNKKPRIGELKTNKGIIPIPKDVQIVVAAGAWTPHVLALMDLYVPVYPLKGYAMSVSASQVLKENPKLRPEDLPSRIVFDKYMYTSRLGDEIRITSIGEFSEWDTKPTPPVDKEFRKEAIRQFPQLESQIKKAQTRCGHRPFVNDGILLLGAVDTHENLFVSCGPGSNGWKLALGSGEVIQRLVDGQSFHDMEQDLGFNAEAFSPAGRVLYSPFFAKLCRARWDV